MNCTDRPPRPRTTRRRCRAAAVSIVAAPLAALGLSSSASADSWSSYCSGWDAGGMCTRLHVYETYGSTNSLGCTSIYYYAGNIGGVDRYELSEVNCYWLNA